jgi:TldD protein
LYGSYEDRPPDCERTVLLLDESLISKVLGAALKEGGDFADLYAERRHTVSMSMEDSRLERSSTGLDSGVSIRVTRGRAVSFVSTDSMDERSLLEAARLAELRCSSWNSIPGYRPM